MTQIRIDEVNESKSGKAWNIRSGDKYYVAYKDSGIEKHKGRTIEAETESFGKGGMAIKTYKLIDLGPAMPLPAPSQVYAAPFWLSYASNVCAKAIEVGLIKEPTDLKAWLFAAKDAAEKAAGNDVSF